MAVIALFHHALGQTAGFAQFADQLRAAGHTVHAPDLYGGRVFSNLDDGVAYASEVGFDTIAGRGEQAVADLGLPPGVVFAGFSLGVLPAQKLAQTRPGALGALLFHSCAPVSSFGGVWPTSVPVQIHAMDADPIFTAEGDMDAARELARSGARGELFLYPGEAHMFADSSLPTYDAKAAALLLRRVLEFLQRVPQSG